MSCFIFEHIFFYIFRYGIISLSDEVANLTHYEVVKIAMHWELDEKKVSNFGCGYNLGWKFKIGFRVRQNDMGLTKNSSVIITDIFHLLRSPNPHSYKR